MRQQLLLAGAAAAGASALWWRQDSASLPPGRYYASQLLLPEAQSESASLTRVDYFDKVPSRAEQLRKLAKGSEHHPFDVLIIGGGATGTGCALDAVTR